MKIVDKTEAELLDKNTNVSILSELGDNKYLVKYDGAINDNIRRLYTKDSFILDKNKTKTLNKSELRK